MCLSSFPPRCRSITTQVTELDCFERNRLSHAEFDLLSDPVGIDLSIVVFAFQPGEHLREPVTIGSEFGFRSGARNSGSSAHQLVEVRQADLAADQLRVRPRTAS